MNLPTVCGADLPRLGWQHAEPFNLAQFDPVGDGLMKPTGGLWTSPFLPGEPGTGWTGWCRAEEFGNPGAPITTLVPHPDAIVYVIDTVDDLKALEQVCRRGPGGGFPVIGMWPEIAWDRLGRLIDAVWLTEAGQWATRFSQPGLYGWDCETVFWLNPKVTAAAAVDA